MRVLVCLGLVLLLAGTSAGRAVAAEPVLVGADRVVADGGAPLTGLRVGLIAHGASVTADGARSVDALLGAGVDVVRLFAPEHGLDGQAPAGASVGNGRDARTGLPVVSLYGDHTQPTREDLAGLDALVFDLQDAGVRFYTYGATMALAQRAARAAGVRFVVLDRPNPLGGDRVEGPVADAAHRGGLTSMTPGPLVHGLTLGELARMAGDVTVVPMTGWTRGMTWADTGRTWVPPSPNLRTPEAALLYPGTGLLESTSISEGRGTRAPFELIGAPGVDGAALAKALRDEPGVTVRATTFVPRRTRAAPSPKFAGRRCSGVSITVTDAAAVEPYALGLRVLRAVRRAPGFAWLGGFDTSVGVARVRRGIDAGAGVAKLQAPDARAIARWRRLRAPFLLY